MPDINPEAEKFQIVLVRLSVLMANAQGKSQKATELRERLACLELHLDGDTVEFMNNLSSDLYMLEDDEIYDRPSPDYSTSQDLRRAIHSAYSAGSWRLLLTLLRQEAPFLRQEIRAYLRARAYEKLEYYAAAWAFYTDAARRDKDHTMLVYLALNSLVKWDSETAVDQAQHYLFDQSTHPAVKILASATVLISYRNSVDNHMQEIKDLAGALVSVLGSANNSDEVPTDVLDTGYAALALSLEFLRDYANAKDILFLLYQRDPKPQLRNEIQRFDDLIKRGRSQNSGVIICTDFVGPYNGSRSNSIENQEDARIRQALLVAA